MLDQLDNQVLLDLSDLQVPQVMQARKELQELLEPQVPQVALEQQVLVVFQAQLELLELQDSLAQQVREVMWDHRVKQVLQDQEVSLAQLVSQDQEVTLGCQVQPDQEANLVPVGDLEHWVLQVLLDQLDLLDPKGQRVQLDNLELVGILGLPVHLGITDRQEIRELQVRTALQVNLVLEVTLERLELPETSVLQDCPVNRGLQALEVSQANKVGLVNLGCPVPLDHLDREDRLVLVVQQVQLDLPELQVVLELQEPLAQ